MRAHAHPHLHLGHNSVTPYPIGRRTVEASPSTANSVRRALVVLTGRVSGDVRFTRCAHRVPKNGQDEFFSGRLSRSYCKIMASLIGFMTHSSPAVRACKSASRRLRTVVFCEPIR